VSREAAREHLVDEPVLHRFLCGHEVVALHVLGDVLERLPGVLGDDLLHPPLERDRLPGLDLDVARLPSKPPESWWMRILAFGSAIRLPFAPAVSRSAPSA
jgi:hypothetical protein